MPTVLITGANRGLGLEFARQYAAAGWRIHAGCRSPSRANDLSAIGKQAAGGLTLHKLDVGSFAEIDALAQTLKREAIDVLVNNAGIGWPPRAPHDDFGKTNYDEWTDVMRINVLAPMRMCEAFVEAVARSDRKVIAMISSKLGSIELATGDLKDHVYRSSKAGLNMVTKLVGEYLKEQRVIPVALGPGWVRTDMGGSTAALSPEESVTGMRRVIAGLKPSDAGAFYSYLGEKLPW
ncbi:MAG: SDR family oxidoreductase [Alphaproteobacteria bacterium]|nr:SDR family oxidoreductase [Alphaproteobacteria bacterium]